MTASTTATTATTTTTATTAQTAVTSTNKNGGQPINSPGGMGNEESTIRSWRSVQTVSKNVIWSILSWPFSALARLCTNIFYKIKGTPTVVDRTLKVEVSNLLWGKTLTNMKVEEAITKGYISYEDVLKKLGTKISVENAKAEGWFEITVGIKNWRGAVTPTKMTLMHAIKNGHITVDDAIKAGHITSKQANAATWIIKKALDKASTK